jgi:hypothetical protein
MILGLHDIKKGKKRFHFESFWPKLDGFQEAVSSAWASVPFGSCPLLSLSVKLKATSRGLQRWSDKRVGHVASQLELARELLHQLKIAQDGRGLSSEESWLRNNLKKHCLALSSLSCTIARLRSRIGWIKEGDANTALFHAHARYRKNKNFIAKVEANDGRVLTTHDDKAVEFDEFYKSLLGSHMESDTTIDLDALGVPSYDLAALDAPFSEEEVWRRSSACRLTRHPGPMASRAGSTCLVGLSSNLMSWRPFRVCGQESSEI